MIKWIAAFIGYSYYRFPGAIIGFILGQIVEKRFAVKRINNINQDQIELNLLTLASIVIKADGRVDKNELSYVRNFFITHFGKNRADKAFKIFNTKIKIQNQSLYEITNYFVQNTQYPFRLQVLHFLYGIANSDGIIEQVEIDKIDEIAKNLKINYADIESIKAMFIKSTDSSYRILEVDKEASVDEIKKAYREMAKKYHPDRIRSKEKSLLKGAEEKFRQVQEAYEAIKKERKF